MESGNSVPEDDEEMYHRDAIECVLVSKTDNSSPCFLPLRLLSVTEFSFTAYHGMVTSIIDFSQLHFLILQNCTNISILLHGVLVPAPHIALKHLQLKNILGRLICIWRFVWDWDENMIVLLGYISMEQQARGGIIRYSAVFQKRLRPQATEFQGQISVYHGDQVAKRLGLPWSCWMLRVEKL